MSGATILMAILGCGDAGTSCEQVQILPVRYESVSACVAAQDAVLARADVMYPVVTAQCREAGSTVPASLDDRPTKDVPAAKRLILKQAALRS